ncbi:hypothetical protein Ae201684P_004992 [Aphanomyces euteiches]|uniref:RING-type domain-containing protein n=1 Tax=Aphanomyces euteiches TaxID=100861 RepID=A0A6G0X111_9STRA|nr:hypothetical protein Ae201684_009703 [Aphanomyces euteiches]KAH9085282.1 hypothetical protein Ae201684P_004992 [Aphanomyces euteiches]KAH9135860.1 hypothetical protein AeRB84_018824 [Aphanomyces euteiches]
MAARHSSFVDAMNGRPKSIQLRLRVRCPMSPKATFPQVVAQFQHPTWAQFIEQSLAPRLRQPRLLPPNLLVEIHPPTDADCVVCMEPITADAARLSACGHIFHTACIRPWLRRNTTCPLCRVGLLHSHRHFHATEIRTHVPEGLQTWVEPAILTVDVALMQVSPDAKPAARNPKCLMHVSLKPDEVGPVAKKAKISAHTPPFPR